MRDSLSTFGQVLDWVRGRLDRVETIMSQNSQNNHTSKDTVSVARKAIEELLKKDEAFKKEYINAAGEAEYEKLVALIQNQETILTEEEEKTAGEMERGWH